MKKQTKIRSTHFNNQGPAFYGEVSDDSLQIEEKQRSGLAPEPLPLDHHNYELTFKKMKNDQFCFRQSKDNIHRSLFTQTERQIIRTLSKPIKNYFKMSIDQLSQLPFADLYSLDLENRDKDKLVLVGTILQTKRVRMKVKIVRVNYNCLSVQQNLGHEERNKLYLLDLLLKQLAKKQFIQNLKLGLAYRKFATKHGLSQDRQDELSNPELSQNELNRYGIVQQQLAQNSRQNIYDEEYYKQGDEIGSQQNWQESAVEKSDIKTQILIFSQIINQIVSSVIKKLMFSAFNSMADFMMKKSDRQKRGRNALSSGSSDLSPIKSLKKDMMIKSQDQLSPNVRSSFTKQLGKEQEKQVQHEQIYEEHEDIQQHGDGFNQLQRLQSYIQELIEQCSQTQNLIKKYFIKWKIHFLERIAESIIVQIKYSDQDAQEQSFEENRIQKQNEVKQNIGEKRRAFTQNQTNINENKLTAYVNQNRQSWSRLTSEVSQGESSLKQQKSQLRQYLIKRHATDLIRCLRQNLQQKRIQDVCIQVNTEKTLHKAFKVFKENYRQNVRMNEMDGYYEEVAENQNQDSSVSWYFWKTNTLHKYFKLFKQNQRNQKFGRLILRTVRKITFRQIKRFSYRQLRYDDKIVKSRQLKAKRRLFRCFNAWKQDYKDSHPYLQRLKTYKMIKEKQLMGYYFSMMKLMIKKSLIKSLKVDKLYNSKLKEKVFMELKLLTQEGQQFRLRQYALNEYLLCKRGSIVIQRLTTFYRDYIEYQRFSVKEDRLRKMIVGVHALKSIKNWRTNHFKKYAYSVIQSKLARVNAKKKKRELFKLWLSKAIEKRNASMDGSDKHKEWLVRYYDGLCSVLPE